MLEATAEIVLIYLRDILVTCQKAGQEAGPQVMFHSTSFPCNIGETLEELGSCLGQSSDGTTGFLVSRFAASRSCQGPIEDDVISVSGDSAA